jgi:hypothetical protein
MLNRHSRISILLTAIAVFLLPFAFVADLQKIDADGRPGTAPTVNGHFAQHGPILSGSGAARPQSISDRIKGKSSSGLVAALTALNSLRICGHAVCSHAPYYVGVSTFRRVSDRSPPHSVTPLSV